MTATEIWLAAGTVFLLLWNSLLTLALGAAIEGAEKIRQAHNSAVDALKAMAKTADGNFKAHGEVLRGHGEAIQLILAFLNLRLEAAEAGQPPPSGTDIPPNLKN